jgi:hypothetical protein
MRFSKPPSEWLRRTYISVIGGKRLNPFAVISLWGKFGGLCARGGTFPYIPPLPSFQNKSFVFRNLLQRKDFQEMFRLA